ncbi:unnamed protein product, partial [Polarella glacialis]
CLPLRAMGKSLAVIDLNLNNKAGDVAASLLDLKRFLNAVPASVEHVPGVLIRVIGTDLPVTMWTPLTKEVSSYFEELHFLMEKVNQPILGVAFGHLGPLGTRLVRSCDVVWAQTTATFSTNEIGLDIPAHRAELVGLVIKQ